MIIAAIKTGILLAITTLVMTNPALFLKWAHVIVLLGCVSLVIMYIGGFRQGIRWIGIVIVGYMLINVFIGVNSNVGTAHNSEYIAPVTGQVISRYGHNDTSIGGFNHGIDYDVPEGTEVKASKSGTISFAGYRGNIHGNLVEIDHPDGTQTAYENNSRVLVTVGQSVTQGDIIALSGNTGRSASPHVHFEIRLNDGRDSVDPAPYLNIK